jgi:thymidine phosphorylase
MLAAVGRADEDPAGALADGRAMRVWRAMVRAQGGDPDAPLPAAAEVEVMTAPRDGVVAAVDALAVGVAAWRLGAGRARKEDPVSAAAGVVLRRRPGERVRAGEPLLELHTEEALRIPAALAVVGDAVTIEAGGHPAGASGPPAGPGVAPVTAGLILDRIS